MEMKRDKHIQISMNKSLRLDNVLVNDIVIIDFNADEIDAVEDYQFFTVVEKMKNEIAVKGAKQIGPLIRYSWAGDDDGGAKIQIGLMLQADRYIDNINTPYRMETAVHVKNCLYTRFTGLEEDIHFAYQKIAVTAYEEDIKLKGSSYTVFLDSNDDGTITADIFMERADE